MSGFDEREKPEYPEKTPRSKDKNQQQTQPTYDAESGNQTWATLVGGECSHHRAIPAPLKDEDVSLITQIRELEYSNRKYLWRRQLRY